ncbi:exopolysaccharide biosynthesis aminotransferase [Bordetella ansorpii]|uniref:Exopolysaccharide biosynthesis aminotransferase n=1 Tax=Bordetella ansorpii TaxID=288768 RepID=A0A157STV4_9BORD|nr:DegT/DnrJ/EryC1/StrS aminotransferase family protein [Bordetella ansorpii]SAI73888.1 exopolysaccharide biosynthesis aminotransferase [Bordetella ansorpii]
MLDTTLSPWPSFTEEEADAVRRVILSNRVNYWTGVECREFEREFAAWTDTRHAVALANGTLALDIAFKALQIGPGDEVIVTPRTFLASVSSIVNAGARPVFADVDLESQNITAQSIEAALTPRTRAVLCVHLAGWPCDMDPIMALARRHDLYVIEDCAQAHGARYRGRSVGALGHIAAWSFCQDKIMTTGGEGGMVTTDNEAWWSAMWSYKDHGKSWDAVYRREHPPGFRWVHDTFGTNARMLEVQAVIGRLQLQRMAYWTARRQAHAARLNEVAERHAAVRVPRVPDDIVHAAYKHYLFIRPEQLAPGWSRDRVIEAINARGIPCYQGSCAEVYLERAFDASDVRPAQPLPNARLLGQTSLMFLVHPTITPAQMDRMAAVLDEVLAQASADPGLSAHAA